VVDDGNLVRHEARLMIIVVDHTDLGAALATTCTPDVDKLSRMLSEWTRRGSLVAKITWIWEPKVPARGGRSQVVAVAVTRAKTWLAVAGKDAAAMVGWAEG
jgi:hypothetical protein